LCLRESEEPLSTVYDVALLDLDGVVYVGSRAVPRAPEALRAARAAGMHLAFVTNNASRPPAEVAHHLTVLDIEVAASEVVTSAQAAARVLAGQLEQGAKVFVIGGLGLFEALEDHGLVPVQDIPAEPVAVVSGFHPDLRWRTVIDGAILVRRGLPWIASNTDRTVPTRYGPGPGNGALVTAVANFAERTPVVAGKPEPPLLEESILRVGGDRPLVVGDRLDTDIEGARRLGLDSLLVMTGVTDLAHLVAVPEGERPTYLSADLAGLISPHPVPHGGELGGWRADVVEESLRIRGKGTVDDWWRVVATTAWRHLDDTGRPVAVEVGTQPGSVGAPVPGEEWSTT